MAAAVKKVVSISLGSDRRDHHVEADFLGVPFSISRQGAREDLHINEIVDDGIRRLQALDGTVDAIGLGGVDVYLYSRKARYAIRDGLRLMEAVKQTPVVDGSGLKNTLERYVIEYLIAHCPEFSIRGEDILMVCAMDRFGMAEAFEEAGAIATYGDFIFGLNVDRPMFSLNELAEQADRLLPQIVRMPIGELYPIGKSQNRQPPNPAYAHYYRKARYVAGDRHLIWKHLPEELDGQVIVTNTVTRDDVEDLRRRGAGTLITTTPEFDGRSFGTNVLEAALLALLGKTWDEVTPQDYLDLIRALDLKPRIERLN